MGQGVLYRHFPTRLDLAFALFDDNFDELEAIAADPSPEAFGRLWSRLLDLTIEASAFVEMVVDARRNLPDYDGAERLLRLVGVDPATGTSRRTRQRRPHRGRCPAGPRMAYGVVITAAGEPATVRAAVDRALSLADH